MSYNDKPNKNIVEIKDLNKRLHERAANAPDCDPFTPAGTQAWTEWSDGCREIEGALREAGEDF